MAWSESGQSIIGNPFVGKRLIGNTLSLDEKDKYTRIFLEADSGNMSFLTGHQAKEIFLKSGLSSKILAKIWNLADVNNDGLISLDQFCLAMHFIHLARQGLFNEELMPPDIVISKKLKELVAEKEHIFEEITNYRSKIGGTDEIFRENESKKLALKNRIQQVLTLIKEHKDLVDIANCQICDNENIVIQLTNLVEGCQLKSNLSKQEYIKLRSHWDNFGCPDPKFEELMEVLNKKKNGILQLENQIKCLKTSLLKKSRKIEMLKSGFLVTIRTNEIDSNDSTQYLNLLNENHVSSKSLSDTVNLDSCGSDIIDANPNEKFRDASIRELVTSEEAYISDLSIIFEVFYSTIESENLLNKGEMNKIFMNLEDILLCNKNFLNALNIRLQECHSSDVGCCLGDVILENLQLMDSYMGFCSSQLASTTFLQNKIDADPKFKEAHKKMCQHPKALGLPLSSFLLKPIQRITRYPLLIEKIIESTLADSKDFKLLNLAKMKAVELCNVTNEALREQHNNDCLTWIQNRVQCDVVPEKLNFNSETNCLGPRKYLHSGSLYKVKSNKELMGLLFSDFMLLTLPSKPIGYVSSVFSPEIKPNVVFKVYHSPIVLNELSIFNVSDDASQSSFKIVHKNRTYHLKTISTIERDVWVKKIDSASKYFHAFEKKKKSKADILKFKSPIGRLLVFVQEGINLTSLSDGDVNIYCEVKVGEQEQKSKMVSGSTNPKWNSFMQFSLVDIEVDVLYIEVLSKKQFSTNVSLGWAEVSLHDVASSIRETKKPLTKHLPLHKVDSSEVIIKLDLQLYEDQK